MRMSTAGTMAIAWTAFSLIAHPAMAENNGHPAPDLLLGPITTYPSREAALRACAGGTVVWADRYEGYYYNAREPKFGTTASGAYACRKDAIAGNYWDTSPLSTMQGHPGRVFPFTPSFVGS